ncbi:tripartite tricarboxylate transporter permease [Kribbella sp. NPDC050124]|uniref:tripartite tricarboxylate transporter permease n=1 Tax=Kribbella sp. NPDC050124 TaxID=3364114 RepID=UPI0037A16FBA
MLSARSRPDQELTRNRSGLLHVLSQAAFGLGLRIGPPEFFVLMVLGISLLVALAGRSMTKALISGVLGLLIAMVGIDPVAGAPRFTFGSDRLLDGISFIAVVIGLFGLSEILATATSSTGKAVAPSPCWPAEGVSRAGLS